MFHGTIRSIRPNRDDGSGFGTIAPDGGGPGLIFYSRGVEAPIQVLGRLLRNLRRGGARREKPFDLLQVGQRVTFAVGADPRRHGRPYAEQVRPEAD